MPKYLLSIYQPDGPPPDDVDLERIGAELGALNQEIQDAGNWVFAGGLAPADNSSVVRASSDGVTLSDGPYVESKEHLGGFTIVDCPNLESAQSWARRLATIVAPLPIEVRLLQQ